MQAGDAQPSRRGLSVTAVLCGIAGITPFAQSLELIGVASPGAIAVVCQTATAAFWYLAAEPITRRWSLAESDAKALAGLALLISVVAFAASGIALAVVQPPSPYSLVSTWLTVALGWLPTHAVTAGAMSLAGSWTSGRRQRVRAAAREAELATVAARAELDALRTRLQPHFLLNALNAVAALARAGDGERAGDVAADLGELLRFALAESGDAIPFDAEREIIERYLAIEQARLGERLIVTWALDPDVRTSRLPALAWQPLVENAIRHGIARRTTPGHLTLTARRAGARLLLVVDADGPDPAGPDATDAPFGGLGIGVSTLERRLALLYDGAATLTIEPRPGGSRTELTLPQDAP